MKVHLIILAAGRSLRYGKKDKLSEQVGGRKLLPSLLFKMEQMKKEWMGYQILVCGENTEKADYTGIRVVNENPEKGISYSVFLALHTLCGLPEWKPQDAVCFCTADQPFLKRRTVENMVEGFLESKKGIGCLFFKGPKNPCVFGGKYVPELLSLTGDTGGKKVLRSHMEDVYFYPAEKEEIWDMDEERTIVIRGAGDLASGVGYVLYQAGYRILMLDVERPACIRRQVAFCQAIYEGVCTVQGVTGRLAAAEEEVKKIWSDKEIPVLIDPECTCLEWVRPMVVIDAILAKKNIGTKRDMAPLTIGLGPGFTAGNDVDLVVETMRGDTLAHVYEEGRALANTGVPGLIEGYGKERVIHAPASGTIRYFYRVGDPVHKGEVIAKVGNTEITSPISGYLRGAIHENYPVVKGLKIMDIEPRMDDRERCFRISDKAEKLGKAIWKAITNWEERCCGN